MEKIISQNKLTESLLNFINKKTNNLLKIFFEKSYKIESFSYKNKNKNQKKNQTFNITVIFKDYQLFYFFFKSAISIKFINDLTLIMLVTI